MTQIAPEKVAAFLDGRLRGKEREEVIAALASSPELLEDFANAAAVLHDAEQREHLDRHDRRSHFDWVVRRRTLLTGIAAAFVLAIAGTWFVSRPSLPDAVELVATLELHGPVNELPQAPWEVTRSGQVGQFSTATAIRLGARLVDLGALIQVNDTAATSAALGLAADVSALPAGGGASVAFRQIATATNPTERRDAYVGAARMTTMLAGDEAVRTGAWLQSARIATRARQVSFFERRDSRAVLAALERLTDERPTASRALTLTRELLAATPLDWVELEAALTDLQRRLGSPAVTR